MNYQLFRNITHEASGKTRPARVRSSVPVTDGQFLNINGRRAYSYHILISLFVLSVFLPTPRFFLLVRRYVQVLSLRNSPPLTRAHCSAHMFPSRKLSIALLRASLWGLALCTYLVHKRASPTFFEVLHQLLQICIGKIEMVESNLEISVNVKFDKLKDLLATLNKTARIKGRGPEIWALLSCYRMMFKIDIRSLVISFYEYD